MASDIGHPSPCSDFDLDVVQERVETIHEEDGQSHPLGESGVENPYEHCQQTAHKTVKPFDALHMGTGNRIGRHVNQRERRASDE